MPDPRISDDDLIGLTRAYLTRRRGQPVPHDLESNALSFAFNRGRAKRVAAVMGVAAIAVASALTAGVVLAFHHQQRPGGATGSTTQAQVRIVRFPGDLLLAPLDRTVRDATIVAALASDIENLPVYPTAERCPADSGTYYSLTFTLPGSSPWMAKVDVTGCEVVQVPGHPTQWAAHTPQLWSDLNDALGIDPRNLPPPASNAGTVVGGIQLRCSPPSSSPAAGMQFIAGSVDVYVGESLGAKSARVRNGTGCCRHQVHLRASAWRLCAHGCRSRQLFHRTLRDGSRQGEGDGDSEHPVSQSVYITTRDARTVRGYELAVQYCIDDHMRRRAPRNSWVLSLPEVRGAGVHASLMCLDLADTLLDTLWRGLVRTTADGIPMRPQKVEYGTASCVHARTHRGRT